VAVEGKLEVGDEHRLQIRHEDGHFDELVWSYHEISPPERLVFGWRVSPRVPSDTAQSLVTITFSEGGAFTEIELRHTAVLSDEELEMFIAGWEGCFVGLEATLHQVV
jgi:uncharacterized protein YndB with AHSA1/START domain